MAAEIAVAAVPLLLASDVCIDRLHRIRQRAQETKRLDCMRWCPSVVESITTAKQPRDSFQWHRRSDISAVDIPCKIEKVSRFAQQCITVPRRERGREG